MKKNVHKIIDTKEAFLKVIAKTKHITYRSTDFDEYNFNLAELDLRDIRIRNLNIYGDSFRDMNLSNAVIENVEFGINNFERLNLKNATLKNVNFHDCPDLKGIILDGATMEDVAILCEDGGAVFLRELAKTKKMKDCYTAAYCDNEDLSDISLSGLNFVSGDFRNTNFSNSHFSDIHFDSGEDFPWNCECLNFSGVKFENVIFKNYDLSRSLFANATMKNVKFEGCKIPYRLALAMYAIQECGIVVPEECDLGLKGKQK